MVELGSTLIDLCIEFQGNCICTLERLGEARVCKRLRLEIDLWFLDVGNADGYVDEVLFGFGLAGSLSPENYL